MLKQTVNKNNIHVPVGVSQVSQLVVMILLINDCYVMSLVVIISRMNFVFTTETITFLLNNLLRTAVENFLGLKYIFVLFEFKHTEIFYFSRRLSAKHQTLNS